MTPKYVRGGIGDILLSLEDAIAEKTIDVFSHYAKAPELFAPFGVEINRFEYFASPEELSAIFIPGEQLPRKKYPKFDVPINDLIRPKRKILGIHIEGSEFSNNAWGRLGQPTKNMSREFLVKLFSEISKDYSEWLIYLFCAPSRGDEIGTLFGQLAVNHYRVVAYESIWDSLSFVPHCNVVLAADSCIKTMAAIQRIPSVVLVGDYPDPFRDSTFLTPYEIDGIMKVVKYKNINLIEPVSVLKDLSLELF